jgi:hypothetical protein
METTLPKDFKEFLKLLNENNVKYLLIGGYAVGFHGYPRATNDIDFWVEKSEENANNLLTVIRKFGFDQPELSKDLFLQSNNLIRMGKEPIKIEIMIDIEGVIFAECYKNRIIANIENINVNIISLPDLKLNKKATGRLKDAADLDYLP